jgi:hypothetical protein
MADSFEDSKEPSGYTNSWEYLEWPSNCRLFKKDSAPVSWLVYFHYPKVGIAARVQAGRLSCRDSITR